MNGAPQLRPGSLPQRPLISPDLPRGVLIIAEDMPYEDSNASTEKTVQRMCEHIHRASRDPYFAGAAHAIPRVWARNPTPVTQFQSLPAASRYLAGVAIADWWFAKHFIKFVPDQEITRKLLGYPDALEALISPEVMIRAIHPEGDCDCFSMFLCCLMQCQSIPWELCALACSRRQPGVWSHIFPRAALGSAFRLPLDASHGTYPGWSVPSRDIQRMAVWDQSGNLVTPPQGEVI